MTLICVMAVLLGGAIIYGVNVIYPYERKFADPTHRLIFKLVMISMALKGAVFVILGGTMILFSVAG